jgi:hypothetical protein
VRFSAASVSLSGQHGFVRVAMRCTQVVHLAATCTARAYQGQCARRALGLLTRVLGVSVCHLASNRTEAAQLLGLVMKDAIGMVSESIKE